VRQATSKTFVILNYQTIQCCVILTTESIVKWNHLVYAEDRWYSHVSQAAALMSPPGVSSFVKIAYSGIHVADSASDGRCRWLAYARGAW
jgi:hypothetical protein